MKRALALAALCLLSVLALPTAANAASGGSTYGPMGCATLSPVAVTQGGSTVFSCNDTFSPDTPVTVTVAGPGCSIDTATPAVAEPSTQPSADAGTARSAAQAAPVRPTSGTFAVDAASDFSVTIDTSKTESGTCTVTATQNSPSRGEQTEQASFQVTEREFAATGFSGSVLPWVGGGLVALGAAFLLGWSIRRRRQGTAG